MLRPIKIYRKKMFYSDYKIKYGHVNTNYMNPR